MKTQQGLEPVPSVRWRTWEDHGSYLEKHPEEVGEDITGAGACPHHEVKNMGGPWILPGEGPRRSR